MCVIGVGFVGASLLENFGRVFNCIGFDTSESRINELKQNGTFDSLPTKVELTTREEDLLRGTHYLIAVSTPVRENGSVDLGSVKAAVKTVLHYAKPGNSIVIESTVPIGTTSKLLGPEKQRFNCGMSPERIDPGRIEPSPYRIPKVVSGLTPKALRHISFIYSQAFQTIVEVSTTETAEMTKLYENCYRMVNIAYVNEISDACRMHNINPNEVIDAAATKPFGFQPFWPGLGVGGHCIPINPYYLFTNNQLPVLKMATNEMQQRPQRMAQEFRNRCIPTHPMPTIDEPLSPLPEPYALPRILIVGIAFKPGQLVTSGSPGLSFAKSLWDIGCERLAFYDPLIEDGKICWLDKLHKRKWNPTYLDNEFDGIAVCVKQNGVDFSVLRRLKKAFVRSFVSLDDKKQPSKHLKIEGDHSTDDKKQPKKNFKTQENRFMNDKKQSKKHLLSNEMAGSRSTEDKKQPSKDLVSNKIEGDHGALQFFQECLQEYSGCSLASNRLQSCEAMA